MPPAAMDHAMMAPKGPVARAKVRGSEKMPEPPCSDHHRGQSEQRELLCRCVRHAASWDVAAVAGVDYYDLVTLNHAAGTSVVDGRRGGHRIRGRRFDLQREIRSGRRDSHPKPWQLTTSRSADGARRAVARARVRFMEKRRVRPASVVASRNSTRPFARARPRHGAQSAARSHGASRGPLTKGKGVSRNRSSAIRGPLACRAPQTGLSVVGEGLARSGTRSRPHARRNRTTRASAGCGTRSCAATEARDTSRAQQSRGDQCRIARGCATARSSAGTR